MSELLRPLLVSVALGTVVALPAVGDDARSWTPPERVLLVVIDTLRSDHLGCYGYDRPTSPVIDALARDGALFLDLRSTSAWTKPAIASLFTGVGPWVHGVEKGTGRELRQGPVDALADAWLTLPEVFRRHGFATVGFCANPHVATATGLAQGFDRLLWSPQRGDGLLRQFLAWLDAPVDVGDRASDAFTSYRYDSEDPASLSGSFVRSIHRDRGGSLWVGTYDTGLNRLDPATGKFEHFRHLPSDPGSLSSDGISALISDRLGNLWIGTRDGGLNVLASGTETFIRYRHDPSNPASLNDDRVLSLLEDRLGNLWIGTFSGLQRMDRAKGQFVRFAHDPDDPSSLSGNTARVLFEDVDSRLWVGTDDGLNLFEPKAGRFVRYQHAPADPNSLSSDRVTSMTQDKSGVLWVGTAAGGANTWQPATWSFAHYRRDPAAASRSPRGGAHGTLSANIVLALSEDRVGNLWIGTFGGGLNRLDRAAVEYRHFGHDPEDPSSLSGDRIMALLHDHRGRLWIGTQTGGLNRYDAATGTFRRYRHDPSHPESLGADGVMTIFEDRQGDLWIGTFGGGLNRLLNDDPEAPAFERFRHDAEDPMSLSNDRVGCLAEDLDGGLWAGTRGGGLNRLDRQTGRFLRLRHDPDRSDSLSQHRVSTLHVDPVGTLWIGTHGGGLLKLVSRDGGGSFAVYSESDGLANHIVSGILSEGSDVL